jgi:hypothetical protein
MKSISKRQLLPVIIFAVTVFIFSPMIYSHTYLESWKTDFKQHMLWAMDLKTLGIEGLPPYIIAHSGWQILLATVNSITGFTFQKIGFIVALLCTESAAIAMLFWFLPNFEKNGISTWKASVIIMGVMIAAPVSLLWPLDGLMYLGYIGITSYQTPTTYLLKPFALAQFIFAYKCFVSFPPLEKRQIMAAAFVSLLSAFIKPSLAICILPAMGIITVKNLVQKRYVNLPAVIFGFGVPTVSVLAWQFLLTYYNNDASGAGISPFTVMSSYSNYLFPKLLLSILFPLSVLLLAFKQAVGDIRMVLGWISFLFGLMFSYFFIESGYRALDGNFIWSSEITLFLLFAVSTLFIVDLPPGKKKSFLQAVWLLQVTSGVVYYCYCLFVNSYF